MNTRHINPWQWQDHLGYAQAVEIKHHAATLYCAGQAAMDPDGKPVPGTMADQISLSLHNVSTVIREAGYREQDIVRLNFYTTSIADFFAAYGEIMGWVKRHGISPSSTLVEVSALAFPELKIEIEATLSK